MKRLSECYKVTIPQSFYSQANKNPAPFAQGGLTLRVTFLRRQQATALYYGTVRTVPYGEMAVQQKTVGRQRENENPLSA